MDGYSYTYISNISEILDSDFYFMTTPTDVLYVYNEALTIDYLYHVVDGIIYKCSDNSIVDSKFSPEIVFIFKNVKFNTYREGDLVHLSLRSNLVLDEADFGILKDGFVYSMLAEPIKADSINYMTADNTFRHVVAPFKKMQLEPINLADIKRKLLYNIKNRKVFKHNDLYNRALYAYDIVVDKNLDAFYLTKLYDHYGFNGYISWSRPSELLYSTGYNFKKDNNILDKDKALFPFGNMKNNGQIVDVLGRTIRLGDFVLIKFTNRSVSYGVVVSSKECILETGKIAKCNKVLLRSHLDNKQSLLENEFTIYTRLLQLYQTYINQEYSKYESKGNIEKGTVYLSKRGTTYSIYLGKYKYKFNCENDRIVMNSIYVLKYKVPEDKDYVDVYLKLNMGKRNHYNFYESLVNKTVTEKDFSYFLNYLGHKNNYGDGELILDFGHFGVNLNKQMCSTIINKVDIPFFMEKFSIKDSYYNVICSFKSSDRR